MTNKPKIQKSDDEWREQLSPEAFQVCRQKGTERAFSGQYHAHKGDGVYLCTCCQNPLFDSKHKFDSGTGWPSFWQAENKECVEEQRDRSHGMIRTEVMCSACGAHLGHVFEDGPVPTNQRFCINSVSLQFKPKVDS